MKTKYQFCSPQRLLCPDNNNANFIAKFEQIVYIIKKTDEEEATPQPRFSDFAMASPNLVGAA